MKRNYFLRRDVKIKNFDNVVAKVCTLSQKQAGDVFRVDQSQTHVKWESSPIFHHLKGLWLTPNKVQLFQWVYPDIISVVYFYFPSKKKFSFKLMLKKEKGCLNCWLFLCFFCFVFMCSSDLCSLDASVDRLNVP